jgi:hypothetical protein
MTEAKTFGHQKVVDYLQLWETMNMKQSEEAKVLPPRQCTSEESVPLP